MLSQFSPEQVALAIDQAAALVLMQERPENADLIREVGEFILAASHYQVAPTADNRRRMVDLARLPEIRAVNYGDSLI